jgi:hypothetical protein
MENQATSNNFHDEKAVKREKLNRMPGDVFPCSSIALKRNQKKHRQL